jgi:hypothetical protein
MPGRLAEGGSFHFVPPAAFDVYIYPPHPPGFFFVKVGTPMVVAPPPPPPPPLPLPLHEHTMLPDTGAASKAATAACDARKSKQAQARARARRSETGPAHRMPTTHYRGSRQRKASVFYPVPCVCVCACRP